LGSIFAQGRGRCDRTKDLMTVLWPKDKFRKENGFLICNDCGLTALESDVNYHNCELGRKMAQATPKSHAPTPQPQQPAKPVEPEKKPMLHDFI